MKLVIEVRLRSEVKINFMVSNRNKTSDAKFSNCDFSEIAEKNGDNG